MFTRTKLYNITITDMTTTSTLVIDDGDWLCRVRPETLNIIYATFLAIIILMNIIGNGLVFTVILMSRALQNQSTNLFLASLSVADILIAVLSIPVKLKQSLNNQFFCMSEGVCWYYFITDTLLSISSITHLLVISIDRFVAIKITYKYLEVINKRKVVKILIALWMYSLFWSLFIIFDWEDVDQVGIFYQRTYPVCLARNDYYFTTLYMVIFLIPMVSMAFMYKAIYKTALRHIKQITTNDIEGTPTDRLRRRRSREFKAIRTVVVVFLMFSACWTPSIAIALSAQTKKGETFWNDLRSNHHDIFITIFFICVQILPPLHSTVNPFIYVIFNRQFRVAIKTLIGQMAGKKYTFKRLDQRMTFYSKHTANGNMITTTRLARSIIDSTRESRERETVL